jgi:predicted transcriptional regulator
MTSSDRLGGRVARVMTTEVATLAADSSIPDAARTMVSNRVSGMPVVDASGTVVGVVSLTDLVAALSRSAASAASFADTDTGFYDPVQLGGLIDEILRSAGDVGDKCLRDIMSTRLITVKEGDSVRDAARLMTKHRVHRVLVVDEVGKLAGIVSALDVVEIAAS